MENLLFIVLVAVVGLIRWLSQMAENKKNAEAARRAGDGGDLTPEIRPAPANSEEERIRKFMEALGVPTSTPPPGKVTPRQVVPREPPQPKFLPIDPFPMPRAGGLPPITTTPPPLVVASPPRPAYQEPLVRPSREATIPVAPPRTTATPVQVATDFEVRNFAEPLPGDAPSELGGLARERGVQEVPDSSAGLRARLATKQALRDAIVLREILGPPRSMQPAGQL